MNSIKLKQPIFLCGMMGAGKSSVGKILADKCGLPFHDLDKLIEDSEQLKIPEIFETKGESYFREIERKLLIKTSQNIEGILALGGGSLQNQVIVDHLKVLGWLVYLKEPEHSLVERLKNSGNRPLLKNEDIQQKISSLLKERSEFYEQAHITIVRAGKSREETADEILKKLKVYEN